MASYYNDNDPYVCQWMRSLIDAGHITNGVVHEQSIVDVKPGDVAGHRQCHFFAGIAGWDLALRLAGFPQDREVWTGSCPCQPFSAAGKKLGESDPRHLWPAFRSLIAECRPATLFGEQVASRDGREWLARVRIDLEDLGYAVGAADLCAAGEGAPHIRQRLFWVANATVEPRQRDAGSVPRTQAKVGREDRPEHGDRAVGSQHGGAGVVRLADSEGERRRVVNTSHVGAPSGKVNAPANDRHAFGLGDTDKSGPQRRREHAGEHAHQRTAGAASVAGGWRNFGIVSCTDGKARRVEPGVFPLAHGVPGRVGRLRGYGNAIVPQAAAKFVKCFLEAENDLRFTG